MRLGSLVGVVVALSLLAAACGGDSTDTSEGTSTTTATDGAPGSTSTTTSEGTSGNDLPAAFEPTIDERAPVDPDAPVDEVADAINEVGWALWATHTDLPEDENAVISPSSIGHALLMARDAGDEATRSAIDTALGFPVGPAAHEGWNVIDQAIVGAAGEQDELTVNLADRIWPRLDVTPEQEWIDLLAAYHGADVSPLDFIGDRSGSRDTINDWVGERTEGLIPELLPEGFIQPETVLVLTDALYFEARWETPFGKYGTVDDEFTLLDGSTVDVELMRELELHSARGTGDGYVGAEISYVGGEFSMLLIVPDEGRFGEVRDRLGDGLIDEIDAAFTQGPFELLLPKWEDETEQLDLYPWLFDIGAAPGSYPGISPEAFLDQAVHGADIAVDEWGTVATAATAFGFNESAAAEPDLVIAADQPFLYLIRHQASGLVLFLGQVTDPSAG